MSRGERFVALGLARPRAPWFHDVGRWATEGVLPLEFLRCLSVEEVRARLGSGHPASALLLDGRVPGIDRDLLSIARSVGCAPLVVDDERVARDWIALGAAEVLSVPLTQDRLRSALEEHALPIAQIPRRTSPDPARQRSATREGTLITVVGRGGVGTSTVAMALAQGLAARPEAGRVLLADLCLDADLALLHDAIDLFPGLPELVEAHRLGTPSRGEIERLTFRLERGYHLLLGLRHHREWTSLRPNAVAAAVRGLRHTFDSVVVDAEPDLEGTEECGSLDVEERNVLARTAVGSADLVVVVGLPSVAGIHGLVRTIEVVQGFDVAPARLLVVVNRAPRGPQARSAIARSVGELTEALGMGCPASPVFLPAARRRDRDLHRDAVALPKALADPLAGACIASLERLGSGDTPQSPEPIPVTPGTIGAFEDEEEPSLP